MTTEKNNKKIDPGCEQKNRSPFILPDAEFTI